MKTFRASALLLICVAAVFGWLWWREREAALPPGVQVVARFDPDTITLITLKVENQPTLQLQKNGETWTIAPQVLAAGAQAPIALPADADRVQQFLQAFAILRSDVVLPEKKLEEYGLKSPRAIVELNGERIQFGAPPFFDAGRIYARVDERVTLLPRVLAQAASRPLEEWRDRRVARFDLATVGRVTLGAQRDIVLEKTRDSTVSPAIGGENWRMMKPLPDAGDSEHIAALLQALQSAEVSKFLDNTGQNWGFDKPTAQLVLDEGAPILTIGRKLNAGYAARGRASGAPFVVSADVVQLLTRPVDYWRSHRLLSFDLNAITRVTLKTRGRTLDYVRDGVRWKAANNATPASNAEVVADILVAVRDWRAQGFHHVPLAESKVPLDFVLSLQGENLAQSLEMWRTQGKWRVRVKRNVFPQQQVYLVSDAAVTNLQGLLERLLAPPPTPAPAQIGPRI